MRFFPLRAHVPTLGFARCHLNPHVCDSLFQSVGSFLGRECQNKSISEYLRRARLLWELAGEITDQKLTLKEHITHQGTAQRNWNYPSENTKTGHRSWLYRGQEEHKAEQLERTPSFRATTQFKKQPVTNSSFQFGGSLHSLSTLTRWLWEHEEACAFTRRDSVLSTYPVPGSRASQPPLLEPLHSPLRGDSHSAQRTGEEMALRNTNPPASRHAHKGRAGLKVSLGTPKPTHLTTCYFSLNKLVPVEFSMSTFQEIKK